MVPPVLLLWTKSTPAVRIKAQTLLSKQSSHKPVQLYVSVNKDTDCAARLPV